MPASPIGWEASSAQLVRIIDPLGGAIAWFAPSMGARCVGFEVRPHNMPDESRDEWRQVIVEAAIRDRTDDRRNTDADRVQSEWRFVERDPASCTMDRQVQDESRHEHWQLKASLSDDQLTLTCTLCNSGSCSISPRIALALTLPSFPEIHSRTAEPTSNCERLNAHAAPGNRTSHANGITLEAHTSQEICVVDTEPMSNEARNILCLITVDDPRSELLPGDSQTLTAVAGIAHP